MVDLLHDATTTASEAGRQLLAEMIGDLLGHHLPVREQPSVRMQLVEIVSSCARESAGLRALVEAMTYLEPDSLATTSLQLRLDEWQAAPMFTGDEWAVFRAALGDLVLPELAELFAHATRSRMPRPPPRCKTAWQVFVYLIGVNAGPDGVPPSMIFLDQVADLLLPDAAQEVRLRNWRRAGEMGLTPALNAARWHPNSNRPSPAASAYLIIQLEADGLDEDQYILSHWYQVEVGAWRPVRGEDQLVHVGDLERAIERLIFDVEENWSEGPGMMTLEFILPWELLNHPVDWWQQESGSTRPIPLAMDYPVVVRSLERLRTRRWHRSWHARWHRLKQEPESATVRWSEPTGEDYHTFLETELKSDDQIVLLVLSEPPLAEGGGRNEVEAALRSGLPVIVWHRSDCHAEGFRETVELLMADGGLAQLPIRARELRRQALRQDPGGRGSHIGRHLTVLWDDPERQPEVSRSSGGFEEGPADDPDAVR
ncbi:MAG TPA: hypothetical protein VJT31_02525 [Rugosimonospora sp.]|nr:hypothetical protein [Rugosimonospora sp.]